MTKSKKVYMIVPGIVAAMAAIREATGDHPRYCRDCGAKMDDAWYYCPWCGARMG